jgi:tripartite-type tricarboxylate transporter receptor subunit TctC
MKLRRRDVLRLTMGAAALPAVSRSAAALDYPTRPVHLIVGFAPGGAPDIIGRLVGQWLSEQFGQPFVIENRPGADSKIGVEAVVRAPPDGYTLFEVSVSNAINATLYAGVDTRDIAPIVGIANAAFVLVVNPSYPAQTIPDLIAHAKANPGKINMGSSATGTPPYLSATMFKSMAEIDIVQVPYRNSKQAVDDLLGGRIDIALSDMSALGYIQAGTLRALAVTTAARQNMLPGIPTVGDFLPGYAANTWYGLGTSKNTPADIIDRLNAATNAALAEPHNKAHLADLGFTVTAGSPADFAKFIADETDKWGDVIRTANIKPE